MKNAQNDRGIDAPRGERFSRLRLKRNRALAAALAAGVGLTLGTRVHAASDTWIGNDGATNNWSDGVDWGGSAPGSGDSLNFGAAGSSGTALNDDLGAGFNIGSISFLNGAAAYTFSTNNGSSISLGNGSTASITNSSTSQETISNVNLALNGNLTADTAYGNLAISSVISGNFNLVKSGAGTLYLTGANTYTGTTTVGDTSVGAGTTATTNFGGGTLDLNFGAAGAPTSNILYNGVTAGQLNMGGGTLEIDGKAGAANSQSVGVVNLSAGFSTIDLNPGSSGTLSMSTGNWTAPPASLTNNNDLAGQMNIILPTGATMTTTQANASSSSKVNGVLSFGNILANVTVNSTSWAVRSGGQVVGLPTASYFASTTFAVGTAAQETDIVASTALILTAAKTNTIRFNTAANDTVSLTIASLTLDGGGILMTPNVGAHTEIISGALGDIVGAPSAGLTIFQYDTLGMLEINTAIDTNGSGNALTIGGGGTVSLTTTATSQFTNSTTIDGGTLIIAQNTNLGAAATGAAVNVNGGTLEANATFGLYNGSAGTNNRSVGIGSNGATIDVTGTNTLTIAGAIVSQNLAGAGNLTKTDTGVLNLSGTNTYNGYTTVTGGILELSGANALPGGVGATGGTSALVINGGEVGLTTTVAAFNRGVGTGANQVQWTNSGGFAAISANATVDLGGALGTVKWNTAGFVPTGDALILGATAATKTVNFQNPIDFNGAVQTVQVNRGTGTPDAILSGVLSDGGFNKTGTGILALTGTSTYTGATNINTGTLQLTSGGSLGNTTVSVNSGTVLTTVGTASQIAGTVMVNSGGALDLRDAAATDTLTIGTLSLAGGGSLGFDVNGNHVNDSLVITTLNNTGVTTLNFASLGTLAAGNTYKLISGVSGISTSDFAFNPNQFAGFTLTTTATGNNNLTLVVNATAAAPATAYWKGTVDNVWSDGSGTSTNWVDVNGNGVAVPGSTTQVVFSASSPSNDASTTLGTITAVAGITLNDPTSLTIGGGSLTIGTVSGITVGSTAGTDVIGTSTIALGAAQTWSNNSSNLLTVSSVVSGASTNALTINSSGTGDILLTGADTYSGGTIISNGTLQVGSAAALGTGGITINGGALDLNGHAITLKGIAGSGGTITDSIATAAAITDTITTSTMTYAGSITNGAGSVALTVAGTGTQVLTGSSNTFTGGTTISTGTLVIGDGTANTGSLPGNVTDNKTLIFNTPASDTVTYSGNVSGTGTLSETGAGTVYLSGDNTMSGGASITAGFMQMGSATGLDNVPVTLAAGSTLDLNSYSVTVKSLNGASGTTALVTNSNVAATSTLTVTNTSTATSTYAGLINNGAGLTALSVGGGTLILTNAANAYTGPTTIASGTLSLKAGGSLGNTAVAVNSGGILSAVGASNTTTDTTSFVGGLVTVNTGGAIDLRNGVAGDVLTLNGGLSLTGGGSLGFDIGATNNLSDSLAVSSFTDVGTTALNFAEIGAVAANNTYTLISGASGISASDFTYNPDAFPNLTLDVFASGSSLMLSVSGPPAPAAIAYWNGNLNSVWSDSSGNSTNWVDANGNTVAIPTSATQVIFSASGATRQASTTIGAVTAVDSITVNDPTNLTIGGSGTLTLEGVATGNGIVINSTAGTDVISTTGIALGGPQTWSNNSSNLLTISSVVSGAAANTLTINSSGTGAILLNAADTYSGGTILANGTLQIGNATALGTGVTTINGGTLDLNGHALTLRGIAGSGGTIADSSTTASILTDTFASGTMTYAGSITNGAGSVGLNLTGAGVQVLTGSTNTATGGTTIGTTSTLVIGDGTANAGSLAGNVANSHVLIFNTPATDTVSYGGNVSGTGTLSETGLGTVNLSGNNTMTGGATISAGTMQMGSNTGLNGVPVTLAANSTMDLNSYSVTVSQFNDAAATTALVTNSNPAATSTLTVLGTSTLTSTYAGVISDGAGQTALSLAGGTLILTNPAHAYTGATTISNGTFVLKGGGSLGNTPVAVNSGGILTTAGATTGTAGTMSVIGGTVTVNSGGAIDLRNGVAGDMLTLGGLSLTGGGSLGFDIGATTAVNDSLAITNFSDVGTTALNFAQIGTLTAGNTYTYTLINGGTGISTSDFSFNSGAFSTNTNTFIASLSAPGGTSLVLTVAAAPPPPLFAYWNGAVDTVWSDFGAGGVTTNWVDANGVSVGNPGSPTQVIFSSTVTTVSNEASTNVGSITSIDSLTLNTATNLTIAGAGTVTIVAAATGNGIVAGPNAGTDVITIAGLTLNAPQTWSNNSSNLLTVSSVINGGTANTLTISNSGTGDILLAGNNAYAGGTIIANGTLQIGTTTALGTGSLTVNGGTLDLNGQLISLDGIAGSGGLITDSTGTYAGITDSLTTGTMTYAGNITDGAGSVSLIIAGAGLQILTGTGNTFSGGTTINLLDTLQIGDGATSAGSLTGNVRSNGTLAFDTPGATTLTYAGNVSGGVGIITETGTGTVVLSGDNTVGLGIDVVSGEVQMGSSKGIDAVPLDLGANSTLDLNSYSITASTFNAAAAATTAVVTNNATGTTTTLTVTGGGTYNGVINNGAGGGVMALTVTGGTLTLANLGSTYSGGTIITGGTVNAGNGVTPATFAPFTDNALGTGAVTVSNATVNLNSQAGTGTGGTAYIFNLSNNFTLNGSATLADETGIDVIGSLAINGTGNALTVQYAQMPLEIGGNLSGSGSVTVSGASNTNPPKNVEFYGDGTNYTGTMTLNAAAAQIFVGNSTALINANLDINGNYTAAPNDTADIYYPNSVGSALVFSPSGTNNIVSIGSITSVHPGDGNIILATSDGQKPVYLTLGNNNGNSKLSGILSDTPAGATPVGGAITKVGTGTATLSGANTYTGGTTIGNGTLVAAYDTASLTASSTGTGNVALNGGVLASNAGATAYVLGNVIAGNTTSQTIAPGGMGTIGSLSIGGLTTSDLTTLNFDLGTGSGEITNGDLLTLGSGTVSIASGTAMTFGGTPVAGNDYRLIGDGSGGTVVDAINLSNFTLPSGSGATYALSNSVDAGFIDLVVTSTGPATMTWNNTGAGSPTDGVTWDTTNNNWNNGSAATTYSDGAAVTFNDTNNGHYAVTLTSTISPGSVTVNNSSNNYTISGMGGKIVDAGAFTKSGSGTLTLGTALSVGSMSITAGTLKLATGVSGGTGPAVTSPIDLTSLSITGSGQFDVNNNHIIITYGSSDPFSTIAGYIQSGYNGGGWNGPGIISSAALIKTNGLSYGVGYADGNDGKVSGLVSGQIEVAYTLLGDANLDGLVNAADFTILAANFNQPVTGWDQGDFNYDGLVNAADFTDLAANFNQSVSGAAVSAGDVAALDAFAAANGLSLPTSSVPEPASMGLLTLGAVGVLARRRRST